MIPLYHSLHLEGVMQQSDFEPHPNNLSYLKSAIL